MQLFCGVLGVLVAERLELADEQLAKTVSELLCLYVRGVVRFR